MDLTLIESARKDGANFLSEAESKELLAQFGAPIGKQLVTRDAKQAAAFAARAGYPVALKGCGRSLLHKTEMGLVELFIRDEADLLARFETLLARLPQDADGLLCSPMLDTRREFIAGLSIDAQFGPVVMFGLGGIFAEVHKDVVFRVAPITEIDAMEMMEGIRSTALLDEVRGMPAVDRDALAKILVAVGRIGAEIDGVTEIDVNPILFDKDAPIVADALVKIA